MQMGGWLRAGVAACLLVGSLSSAGGEEPAAAPVAAPAQADVDRAMARGVAWLRADQDPDGSFGPQPGETALALLALRHCGVREDDPACRRAATRLLRELPDGTSYGASLGLVALLGQEGKPCRDKAARLLDELLGSQCSNGQWSYSTRRSGRGGAGDNSNTQLAVFALAAARARGLDVPRAAFERALAYFRATGNTDGGWGYAERERSSSYASMTAGGVMIVSLSVDAPLPGDARLASLPEVSGALAWLGERFDPGTNSGAAEAFGSRKGRRGGDFWRHYWLWSVERACATAGVERLGKHDWYGEGARYLLDRQRKDGAWLGPERDVLATSFALLFLARGTLRVVTPRDVIRPAVTPR